MGVQDRDWWRERYAKREGMRYNAGKGTYSNAQDWYDPKQFRARRHPEAAPEASKQRPPKRPHVVQKVADSGLADLPGSNWALSLQLLFFCVLGIGLYGAHKLQSDKKQHVSKPPAQQVLAPLPAPRILPAAPTTADAAMQKKMERRQLEYQQAAAARAEEVARAAKREAQWQRFYQPSATCSSNPGTVDCANEFIRARRAFDASH